MATRRRFSRRSIFSHIPARGPKAARIGALACFAIAALTLTGCKKEAAPAPQPPDVEMVSAITQNVPVYGEWVGSLDGFTNAQISPQVSGYLLKQNYREGSYVHKGDVLFEIDPRPFQAILDQAKGQLAQSHAQLDLANINVKRDSRWPSCTPSRRASSIRTRKRKPQRRPLCKPLKRASKLPI